LPKPPSPLPSGTTRRYARRAGSPRSRSKVASADKSRCGAVVTRACAMPFITWREPLRNGIRISAVCMRLCGPKA
jgi:hypothetical protein